MTMNRNNNLAVWCVFLLALVPSVLLVLFHFLDYKAYTINVAEINLYKPESGLRSDEAINKFEELLFISTITEEEWLAILEVETKLGTFYTEKGPATDGAAQIQTTCIRDVNRLLGEERYTFADRYNPYKVREIFNVYTNYYAGTQAPFEIKARVWNGGPNGATEQATIAYWGKIKKVLEDQK